MNSILEKLMNGIAEEDLKNKLKGKAKIEISYDGGIIEVSVEGKRFLLESLVGCLLTEIAYKHHDNPYETSHRCLEAWEIIEDIENLSKEAEGKNQYGDKKNTM